MDLTKTNFRLIDKQYVSTYPIGIKEDKLWPSGELEGLEEL